MNKRIEPMLACCRVAVAAASVFWAVPSEAVDDCSICGADSVVEDSQTYDYSWLKKAVTVQGTAWEFTEEYDHLQGAVTMKVGAFNPASKFPVQQAPYVQC